MKSNLIVIFFLIFLFQRCNYTEILYRKDETIEIEEWVDEFNTIIVEEAINLVLRQTDDQIAVISGLDYKVNNLTLKIEDKELLIDSKELVYNRKDQAVTLHLPVKSLKKISLNKPTLLSSENEILIDNFILVVNGPGTYSESNLTLNGKSVTVGAFGNNSGHHILKGSTDKLHLRMEGLAWTNASQMKAADVTFIQRSLKSSYVNATDVLSVDMYSSGNVYYSGSPILDFKTVTPDWQVKFGSAIHQPE